MKYNNETNTESGVYYLVPNRHGQKRIIKKPRPALTSTPLNDDFDAATTMYTTKGRHSWVTSQPPLDDEFDAVTYTNTHNGFDKIEEVNEDEFETPVSGGGGRGHTYTEEEDVGITDGRDEDHGHDVDDDTVHCYPRHPKQPSTSREQNGYSPSYHRIRHPASPSPRPHSRTQPRVQVSRSRSRSEHRQPPQPNSHLHSQPHPRSNSRYPSDEFASRYVKESHQESTYPYANGSGVGIANPDGQSSFHVQHRHYGNAHGNELVRSASRRSSNHTRNHSSRHQNGHGSRHRQSSRDPVFRTEEMIRHSPLPEHDEDRYHQHTSTTHRSHSRSRKYKEGSLIQHVSPSRSRSRTTMQTSRPQTSSSRQQKAITNGPMRAPVAKQSYEVIKSRVLKDTPEKTVTIATWRQRVADSTPRPRRETRLESEPGSPLRRDFDYVDRISNREAEGEMDVYYIGGDDYAAEDGAGRIIEQQVFERKVVMNEGSGRERWEVPRFKESSGPVDWMGSHSPRLVERAMSNSGSKKGKEREIPSEIGEDDDDSRSDVRERVQTPWPSLSEMADIDDELEHEKKTDLKTERVQTPPPRDWPVLDEDDPHAPHYKSTYTAPLTSTPLRRRGSLPGDNSEPPPLPPKSLSLFPTRSNGSTISSIPVLDSFGTPRPSASTLPSSVQPLDDVLGSCHPSLSHLGHILFELGIRTEDHLRAMSKMSEATRDRELKQVALKRGVTVFEWAILLDKLSQL